ncbi:MAG TPA: ATP-binding protein [Labilithrix sp.]|nr:ATP-binding protein [Labilithrix sp.]
MAARALPGSAMTPLIMVLFTVVVGPRSPFWQASLWITGSAIGLFAVRMWVTLKCKTLPDSAAAAPWRRAFDGVTVASLLLMGGYIGYGTYVLGVGLTSAMMVFAGSCIMSDTLLVYAPSRALLRAAVIILYVGPAVGLALATSSGSYMVLGLVTLQTGYSFVQGARLHEEYWQLAVARARVAEGNTSMRVVLDNIDQAIMTIDIAGRLASERSVAADRWFGQLAGGSSFVDYIATVDPGFAEQFALAHESFVEDVMPREVSVAQLPSRLRCADRHYRCKYLELANMGLLIVIDDMTESVRRTQEEVLQKELLAVAQGLMADRAGYLAFFEDSTDLVEELLAEDLDRASRERLLHTLKGNAAMVGAVALASQCHLAEEELEESDAVSSATLALVGARWNAIATATTSILGSARLGVVEIPSAAIDDLSGRLRAGTPGGEIAAELEDWKLELAERPLARLARYAVPLAARLEKGTLSAKVVASRLRLDPKRWAPLWSVLVHVVRNAVDHGIESHDERVALGKPPPRLTLGANVASDQLVVEVADDGRGIDWSRVREKAAARGMPAETGDHLLSALLDPGFTTRDQVTTLSGRGVGMAAVDEEIRRLGGSLAVESERGRGTTWRFTFPLRSEPKQWPRVA